MLKNKNMKLNIKFFATIVTIILFNSCFLYDIGADPIIVFKPYWTNDISNTRDSNTIVINNDTLELIDFNCVITDLKLINNEGEIISLADNRVIHNNTYIRVNTSKGGIHNISFNFGERNLESENHFYFMTMDFLNKSNDSIYSYNIVSKNKSSKVSPFNTTIDDYHLGGGLFVNEAIIGLNLKNLFTNPNQIHIDSLTSGSIDNDELQLKMMENAKNMFFLDRFVYD